MLSFVVVTSQRNELFVMTKWKHDWHDGHRVEAYANQVNKLDWRSEK